MIDPHVHLRDWDLVEKDTLAHGLLTAARAGFTHLFDMPNTSPPLTSIPLIKRRIDEAKQICSEIRVSEGLDIYYSLYGGLTGTYGQVKNVAEAAKELFPDVVGLKLFAGNSTGNMGLTDLEQRKFVFSTLSDLNYRGVVAVHCEKQELIRKGEESDSFLYLHNRKRPPEAELVSVEEQIKLADSTGFKGTLHICHISNPASIDCIEAYRENVPFTITCGVTPHHLLFDIDTNDPEKLMQVNPPVRPPSMRRELFDALCDRRIDWIESDHAPHQLTAKREGASGIPGFAGYLLLIELLRREGVDEERLRDLTGGRVTEIFRLPEPYNHLPDPDDFFSRFTASSIEYPADPYRRFYADAVKKFHP